MTGSITEPDHALELISVPESLDEASVLCRGGLFLLMTAHQVALVRRECLDRPTCHPLGSSAVPAPCNDRSGVQQQGV